MRGDFIAKILETIGGLAASTTDLFDVILSSGYGASFSKLDYEFSKRQKERNSRSIERDFKKQEKQKYHTLIYYLKRNGLIKERKKDDKKFFILTKKGEEKLSFLKKQEKERLPTPSYQKGQRGKSTIIIFDIPEIEKRKRNWLRTALRNLGFKMIQKSAWIGKVKIPKEFLDDLYEMKLVDYVEIFEISKRGSLERLI